MRRFYIASMMLACLGLMVRISFAAPMRFNPRINIPVTEKVVTLKPVITGYSITKCLAPGSDFMINGYNFGSSSGKRVMLGGHGITLPLKIVSWSSAQIGVHAPASPELTEGQQYYAGIQQSPSNQWLSNTRTFTICSSASPGVKFRTLPRNMVITSTKPSGLQVIPSPPHFSGGSLKLPPAPVPPVLPSSGGPANTGGSGSGYYDNDSGYDDGGYIQNNSGQLIGSGLPQAPTPPPVEGVKAEADPDTIEPGEVMIASASMDEAKSLAQQAEGMGLRIKSRKLLKSLGLVISVFSTPQGMTATQALAQLRQAFPRIWVDANHRFNLQGGGKTRDYARKLIRWHPGAAKCAAGVRIGMVDTLVSTSVPALNGANIHARSLTERGMTAAPPAHGTAIAALLAGQPGSGFEGLAPKAHIYAAEVFRQRDKRHIDATTERILTGLDWLASNQVQVINLSFGGSKDMLLELAIRQLLKQGIAVVAAAGNRGADGDAIYPAAQEGVIAVTAVDAQSKPYVHANHGTYIDYAAPGVDVWVDEGNGRYVSGTSYAAPFVSAAVAAARVATRNTPPGQWMTLLRSQARDLGQQGRDSVFGWGLIQVEHICVR